MNHFVDNHILEQVLWFFYQLGVQTNVPRLMIATAPSCLHPLKEVAGYLDAQLRLPFADKFGNGTVQERLVPLMHDRLTLRPAAAGAHDESNAAMPQLDRRLCIF